MKNHHFYCALPLTAFPYFMGSSKLGGRFSALWVRI
jgi:hypothetical protein